MISSLLNCRLGNSSSALLRPQLQLLDHNWLLVLHKNRLLLLLVLNRTLVLHMLGELRLLNLYNLLLHILSRRGLLLHYMMDYRPLLLLQNWLLLLHKLMLLLRINHHLPNDLLAATVGLQNLVDNMLLLLLLLVRLLVDEDNLALLARLMDQNGLGLLNNDRLLCWHVAATTAGCLEIKLPRRRLEDLLPPTGMAANQQGLT
jgi:hypothetical protein